MEWDNYGGGGTPRIRRGEPNCTTSPLEEIEEIIVDFERGDRMPDLAYLSVSDREFKPKVYNEGFTYSVTAWRWLHHATKKHAYSTMVYENGVRRKENVIGYGNVLIYDVDGGYRAEEAIEALKGLQALIVTTRSHTPQEHRFRILLPGDACLSNRVDDRTYREIMETALAYIGLDTEKIDAKCMTTDRQYAPNPAQRHCYLEGAKLPLLEIGRIVLEAQRQQELKKRARPPRIRASYDGPSPIESFNRDHTIEELLERYEYRRVGKRWLSPHSESGDPGVTVLTGDDGRTRAYSHHDSDTWDLADPFDLFVIHEYDGDANRALEALKGGAA